MKVGPWDDWLPGVLSKRQVKALIQKRFIRNASTDRGDLDYSSIDLRLGDEAYQLKACVKGFGRNFVGELLDQKLAKLLKPESDGVSYLLKRRHSYLFKLMEQIQELKGTPIYGVRDCQKLHRTHGCPSAADRRWHGRLRRFRARQNRGRRPGSGSHPYDVQRSRETRDLIDTASSI